MSTFVFILAVVAAYYWGLGPAYLVWFIGEILTLFINGQRNADTEHLFSSNSQSQSTGGYQSNGTKERKQSMAKENINHWYSVLGIASDATDLEVKKAYRKLAMECHPDRCVNSSEEVRRRAGDKFREVNNAYEAVKEFRQMK
jgi:hypothetical protein